MPRNNFINQRGANKAKPEEVVLKKGFTIKLTEGDFKSIAETCDELGIERTDWARNLILTDLVRLKALAKEKQAMMPTPISPKDDSVPPKDDVGELTVRQRADIHGFKVRMTVEEIAREVGVTVEQVRSVLGQ